MGARSRWWQFRLIKRSDRGLRGASGPSAGQGRSRDRDRVGRGCNRDVTRGCKWRDLDQGSISICNVKLPVVRAWERVRVRSEAALVSSIQLVQCRSNNIIVGAAKDGDRERDDTDAFFCTVVSRGSVWVS